MERVSVGGHRWLAAVVVALTGMLLGGCGGGHAPAPSALRWSAPFTVDTVGGPNAAAVACPSTDQCTQLDAQGGEVTFDPTTTSSASIRPAAGVDPGGDLSNDLACPSVTQCTAVDEDGRVATFDPTAAQPAPRLVALATHLQNPTLGPIVCPTVSQCSVIDGDDREITFDPRAATQHHTVRTLDPPKEYLHSVDAPNIGGLACPTATQCTTVDSKGRALTFDPTTKAAVHFTAHATAPHDALEYELACPTTTQCTVTSQDSNVASTFDPRARTASAVTTPLTGLTTMSQISCLSARRCTAIDDEGTEISFDPRVPSSAGHPHPSGMGGSVGGMSCPSAHQCTVTGRQGEQTTFDPASTPRGKLTRIVRGTSPTAAACSGSQCVEFDQYAYATTFGYSPSDVTAPATVGYLLIDAAACASAHQCTMVDANFGEETLDPTRPATTQTRWMISGARSGTAVVGVACPTARQCTAIDSAGDEATVDPSAGRPRIIGQMKLRAPGQFTALACAGTAQCTAVDGADEVTFNPQAAGSAHQGEDLGTKAQMDPGGMTAVACPRSTYCTAVSDTGFAVGFDPSASDPHPTDVQIDRGRKLTSVACPASGPCLAGDEFGWVVRLNANDVRGASAPTRIAGANSIRAVACQSARHCLVLDAGGNAFTSTP